MVMKDRATDLFESVGLDLVARPYATNKATSAPEIAACAEEIFGTDADLITWDFAMTDGRWYWRMEFFAHRINRLPNHPAMLVLNAGIDPERESLVRYVTGQGLTAMRQDDRYLMGRQIAFPDSRYRTEEELKQMPDHVRNYRCSFLVESGSPCADHKFTHNGTCDGRSGRTNWHHGWKWHAFHGNVYALFLMEVMEDALLELVRKKAQDPRDIFDLLTKEEFDNYRWFEGKAGIKYANKWTINEVAAKKLYGDPTYCHTALLPAQTRYLGHAFNAERYDDWFSYWKGWPLYKTEANPTKDIRLSYVPKRRTDKCDVPLSIDHPGFFVASNSYNGYQKVTIPNKAELTAYGGHSTNGIIMVCTATCAFECKDQLLAQPDFIHKGKAKFRVNGEDVASVERFETCFLLKRENGDLYWPGESYDIEVETLSPGRHFEFTSFIVW